MKIYLLLARTAEWFGRFFRCCDNLGFRNAVIMLIKIRFSDNEMSFQLKNKNKFYFRGFRDKGVISHFFKEMFYIDDSKSKSSVSTIIDCGANIGDETVKFAIRYPNAEIVALEPEQANYDLLVKNTNNFNNIFTIQAGVWFKDIYLKVFPSPSGSNEAFYVEEVKMGGANTVPARSISSIMKKRGWDTVDLLKIDIEGAEYELFSHNTNEWLPRVKAIVIECNDNDRKGATYAMFRALLSEEKQFDCYFHGENYIFIRNDVDWKLKPRINL
jgi:FkbM family methyltransferase